MAGKRGRPAKTATGGPRSSAGRASLRPGRLSTADGRSPFHFDHKSHAKAAPGQRASGDRQSYIERPGAVERAAVQQGYIERDGAPEIIDGRLAEAGNIANTFEDRRAFWNDVERQERKNGRVQLSIIAALPCELSPASRLAVLQSFVASEFESRNLPFHGVIHSPGPTNDARNFHAHILYYDRPGTRDAAGAWSFGANGKAADGFPWGTEKPAARLKRLEKALTSAPEKGVRRKKLEAQIDETRGFRPAMQSIKNNKNRPTYPWGLEAAPTRAKRLQKRIAEAAGDSERAATYRHQLAEVEAWKASPPPAATITVGDVKFVRHLRSAWSEATNRQLEADGVSRRYSPESYKALGIDATPSKPLGTRVAALEKQGIATPASEANTQIAIARRIAAGETLEAIQREAAIQAAASRRRHAERQHKAAKGLGRTADELAWHGEVGKARQAEYLAKPKPTRNIPPAFKDILTRPLRSPAAIVEPVATPAAARERVMANVAAPVVATPAPVQVAAPVAAKPADPAPAVATLAPIATPAAVRERVISSTPAPVVATPAPRENWPSIPPALPAPRNQRTSGVAKPDKLSPLMRAAVRGRLSHGETTEGGGRGRSANAVAGSKADAIASMPAKVRHSHETQIKQHETLSALKDIRFCAEAVMSSSQKLADAMPDIYENSINFFKKHNLDTASKRESVVHDMNRINFFETQVERRGVKPLLQAHHNDLKSLSKAGEKLSQAVANGSSFTDRQKDTLQAMRSVLGLAISWIPSAPGDASGASVAKSVFSANTYMPRQKAVVKKQTNNSNVSYRQPAPAKTPVFVPPPRSR